MFIKLVKANLLSGKTLIDISKLSIVSNYTFFIYKVNYITISVLSIRVYPIKTDAM